MYCYRRRHVTKLVSMTLAVACHDLNQGHISKRVHRQNWCQCQDFSLVISIGIIFLTFVVHYTEVYHDLELRSYHQGHGHSANISRNACLGFDFSLVCCIWIIFQTVFTHDQGCVMTLTQSHIF